MTTSQRLAFAREWAHVPLDDLASAIEQAVEVRRLARRGASDAALAAVTTQLSTLLDLWRERTESRYFTADRYAVLIGEGPEPRFIMLPVRALPVPSLN